MILRTVHIENYKCVKDSNEFRVDEKVTCLVGKNESGKTAVLQALSKLNPVEGSDVLPDFDDLEYPRHKLSEYQESDEYADALTTTWQLDKNDISELESIIGAAASNLGSITISKGYQNEVVYDLGIDEAAVVAHTIDRHDLMDDEKRALQDANDVAELHKRLSELTDPTQRQKDLLEYVGRPLVGILLPKRSPICWALAFRKLPIFLTTSGCLDRYRSMTLRPVNQTTLWSRAITYS